MSQASELIASQVGSAISNQRTWGSIIYNVNDPQYGAKGDGITDDTTAIQSALNACDNGIIFLPIPIPALTANYKISNTLFFKPGQKIVGVSRSGVTITMTDNTKYAFEYLSPLTNTAYDITSGIVFESLTIKAKYGIRINQSGDYTTIFAKQGNIKGPVFRNLGILGVYDTITDPSKDTNVVPTKTELEGYGVGIRCAKVFDAVIFNCQIENFGMGIYFDGCDIGQIDGASRFTVNARHIHIYNHDTYGSQNKILNCDLLMNKRIGAIYLEGSPFTTISDNYFECYTAASQFITTTDDYGTLIRANRIDNTGQTTPFFSLNPRYGCMVTENRWNPSPNPSPIEIKSDYYSKNTLVIWKDNEFTMPTPDYPCAQVDDYDPSLFNYRNFFNLRGVASTNFPFVKSGVTSKWVVSTTAASSFITDIYPRSTLKKYIVEFIGRKVSGAGFCVITYNEGGATTLFSSALGFTNTANTEKIQLSVQIPSGKIGNGYFTVELVNTEVEYESFRFIPTDVLLGTVAPTSGTYVVGDEVKNTSRTELGTAGSKYVILGWVCSVAGTPGTWIPMRSITGN